LWDFDLLKGFKIIVQNTDLKEKFNMNQMATINGNHKWQLKKSSFRSVAERLKMLFFYVLKHSGKCN
jgi:hypothetical protein